MRRLFSFLFIYFCFVCIFNSVPNVLAVMLESVINHYSSCSEISINISICKPLIVGA